MKTRSGVFKKVGISICRQALFWLLLWVLWLGGAQAGTDEDRDRERRLLLLPRVGASLEAVGYISKPRNASGLASMDVEVEMMRYGRHLIYLRFREDTTLGVPERVWEFNRVIYQLATPGYRYDLGEHYVGVLAHHWCINNFNSVSFRGLGSGRNFCSIYSLSLEFLDKGMLLGLKDRGIVYDPARPFEWLGRWHYQAKAGRIFTIDPEPLRIKWEMEGQVRLDLFRYRRLVPYLSGGTLVWVGPSWRFFPRGEAGVRLHVRDNLNLIPFISGGRQPEIYRPPEGIQYIQRQAKGFLSAGLRMETSLGSPGEGRTQGEGWQFLPEVHGNLGYHWLAKSHYAGWDGDIVLNLELLRKDPWTVFCYTGVHVDTKKTDLSIKKGIYWLQYGLTYSQKPYFAEAFLEHSKRLDGRDFNNLPESTHQAGVRLGTQGMKPGYYNYGISFDPRGFHWLNKFSAQVSAAHYFQNQNWQYLWNVGTQGRWDICRYGPLVAYASGGAAWLDGGGATQDGVDGTVETGIRIHGKADLTVFYRYQHLTMGRKIWGPADNRSVIGVEAFF